MPIKPSEVWSSLPPRLRREVANDLAAALGR